MDINGLVNMVSALKNDDKNIGEFSIMEGLVCTR